MPVSWHFQLQTHKLQTSHVEGTDVRLGGTSYHRHVCIHKNEQTEGSGFIQMPFFHQMIILQLNLLSGHKSKSVGSRGYSAFLRISPRMYKYYIKSP